jgi:hypothetical protein
LQTLEFSAGLTSRMMLAPLAAGLLARGSASVGHAKTWLAKK